MNVELTAALNRPSYVYNSSTLRMAGNRIEKKKKKKKMGPPFDGESTAFYTIFEFDSCVLC